MELIEQYRVMHESGSFAGWAGQAFVPELVKLMNVTTSHSVLDYGCGNSLLDLPGFEVGRYDPGVQRYSRRPRKCYDGVFCTDVLEHIAEVDLPALIADLVRHANKFILVSICCRPARQKLPDGRNCHLTVRPFSWWLNLLRDAVPDRIRLVVLETP